MILLEPELEDGVDEGVGVSISLYDVLFGQRLLIPADGLWRAKRISSVNVLCIEMAFSVRDGNQHVDLGNGEAINVSLKDRSIGVNEQDGLLLEYLLRHGRLGSIPDKKAQLLDIPTVTLGDVADSVGKLHRDALSCFRKRIDDIRYPIFPRYLLEIEHLTKAVERIVGIVEDVRHHVPFAAIEAIGHVFLLLPDRPHEPLHLFPFWQQCQLLKC